MNKERLQKILQNYALIEQKLSDPLIGNDPKRLHELSLERLKLEDVVALIKTKNQIETQLSEVQQQLNSEKDPEFISVLKEELESLEQKQQENEETLKIALLPKDPDSGKNIYLEIRAGTGGEEAALFARNLFRMYLRYFEDQSIRYEIISQSDTGLDGLKEVIVLVKDNRAYDLLHLEGGGHRVQRIPVTESQGRIHTSACTVAVIPEVEESEINIDQNDLRIDVFRSSGAGGQHVNTTDSAVRITHIPSGLVVSCQDEKSQHKNKAKALKVLQIRLSELQREQAHEKMAADKKMQIGSGDRSQRIRTYNFPQNRLTDHRINFTSYNLDKVMEGDLDELFEALRRSETEEKLALMQKEGL